MKVKRSAKDMFFFIENPVSFHNCATQRNPSVYYYIQIGRDIAMKGATPTQNIALLDDHMCTKIFCNIKK